MVSFIDEHRGVYGVEPICAVLPIAPSTYYEQKSRQADPTRLPARTRRDQELRGHIRRVWDENFSVYGVRKVWRQMNREGIGVARCTVGRLIPRMGFLGAVRGRKLGTTIRDESTNHPLDLVARDFTPARPGKLWVSDRSYVPTWRGEEHVEDRTLSWVAWFKQWRLPESIGYVFPSEHEDEYGPRQNRRAVPAGLNQETLRGNRSGSVLRRAAAPVRGRAPAVISSIS